MQKYCETYKFKFTTTPRALTIKGIVLTLFFASIPQINNIIRDAGMWYNIAPYLFIIYIFVLMFLLQGVVPKLSKFTGRGYIYDDFVTIRMDMKKYKIQYSEIVDIELHNVHGKYPWTYIIILKSNGNKIKISSGVRTMMIDNEFLLLEAFYIALYERWFVYQNSHEKT